VSTVSENEYYVRLYSRYLFRCQHAVLTGNEEDNLALCDQCRFAFCKKCKKTYHSQTLCGHELELLELKEKRRKLRLRMQVLNLQPEDENKLLKDFLAIARIENSTRLCPNPRCQVPIEKNMGCDHMFCTHCKIRFNWSEARDQSTETNVLFTSYENDLEKVEQALARERADEDTDNAANLPIIGTLIIKRSKKCPNIKCGKMNIKSGTGNYLICQYCKRGFCFSCGQSINNPNRHFGNACKRHSAL
jgi:E3 ubiquitin-protein ligase RNF14